MSCATGRPTFRLLDRRAGWCDVRLVDGAWVDIGPPPVWKNVTKWDDPDGIQLLVAGETPGQNVIDAQALLASLPPRRLVRLRPWFLALAYQGRHGAKARPMHRMLASGLVR